MKKKRANLEKGALHKKGEELKKGVLRKMGELKRSTNERASSLTSERGEERTLVGAKKN